MNGADTVWIFTATALVLFMTLPGIALFYGGLVRSRNVLSVLMQCFTLTCLLSLLWFALGYSIAFGTQNPIWGGLGKAFLHGVTPQSLTQTIPEILFFHLSNDLRHHHPRADDRRVCRTGAFRLPAGNIEPVAIAGLRPRDLTGFGAEACYLAVKTRCSPSPFWTLRAG